MSNSHTMMLSSGSSWRTPLAKLVGLVVVLPFGATYLHLHRRSFLVNEYCFVGPAAPDDDGAVPRDYILRNAIAGAVADDNGRDVVFVDNGVRVDGSGGGRSAGRHGGVADGGYPYHGIYAPASSTGSGQGRGADDDGRRDFPQRYSPIDDDVDDGSPRWWPWTRPGTIGRAGGWQSVARSSAVAFLPPSSSSRGARSDRVIAFVDAVGGGGGGGGTGGMWCLKSSLSSAAIPEDEDEGEDVRSWCADVEGGGGVPSSRYPPSGMWKSSDPRGGTARPPPPPPSLLRITCPPPTPAAAISAPSGGGGRRGVRNPERNENLGFVLDKPGTTLLLLLNVGLAFHYWNRRIDPSSVCKRYDRIAIDGEWWRGLSGATAHFEPLHLGFNMMSLRALGDELEGAGGKWYGDAFAFLAYNVALVVFTTIVMMALVRARLSWTRRELDALPPPSPPRASCEERMARLRGTSSVGYSAVLFAWMVISTMERAGPTCPVPFFSDLCFETRAVPGMPYLRYNAAPVVSLFAAQFVMPRASFMGHLAGIICGFCLHWGIFPPLEVCSPNVLVGGTFLVGLIWRGWVAPVRPLLAAGMDEEGRAEHEDYLGSLLDVEVGGAGGVDNDTSRQIPGQDSGNGSLATHDPIAVGKRRKRERELNDARRKQRTLLSVRNLIATVSLASPLVFDWNSSLVLSQCLLLAYFVFGIQSSSIVWAYARSEVADNDIVTPEKKRAGAIWRGFVMSATLSVVVDSMSFASWLSVPIISSAMPAVGLPAASLFMTFRLAVNLLALVVSSKILHDLGEVGGGIHAHVFSPVICWTRSVGDNGVFAPHRRPLWTAFEGRGITLGRRQADVV